MNTLTRSNQSIPGDEQAKFIQDRISNTEKHVGEICSTLGNYTRNAARFRDKTDEVVSTISQYAESETVNQTLHCALQGFASCYSAIGDHRDAFVRRLENHVVGSFAPVGVQCKEVRDEVKAAFTARDREVGRRKQLDKLKQRNPRNRPKILLAETELARASADVSRTLRSLEDHMDAFEANKLNATTGALRNLVRAEMALHAREMELLTQAYADLALVDEEQDLEEFRLARGELDTGFRSAVRSPQTEEPIVAGSRSQFRASLKSSIANLFSTSSSSLGRGNLKTDTSAAGGSTAIPRPHSATLRRGIKEVNNDLEYADSLTSEDTTSTEEEEEEPKFARRSVSTPKLSGGFK